MVRIQLRYEGGLRCSARHEPSGRTLVTDAPEDNHGRGETFSPTDLVATAFGACVMTIMGIHAEREGLSLEGLSVRIDKIMSSEPPRRIARLEAVFTMPAGLPERARRALEHCADVCPVRLSLHSSCELPVRFEYPDS
jgi:putative redox protein